MNKIKSLGVLLPTHNHITDGFGVCRDWAQKGRLDPDTGRLGWNPMSGYRPIHYGVDFASYPDRAVYMPVQGQTWGYNFDRDPDRDLRNIGTLIDIIPVDESGPVDWTMFYLAHMNPLPGKWTEHLQGKPITTHGDHGIGYAHLHWEVAVTMDVYAEMVRAGLIDSTEISDKVIENRARARGLPIESTLDCIHNQMTTDGILRIEQDAIIRKANFNEYKGSRFSRVWQEETAVINPLKLLV